MGNRISRRRDNRSSPTHRSENVFYLDDDDPLSLHTRRFDSDETYFDIDRNYSSTRDETSSTRDETVDENESQSITRDETVDENESQVDPSISSFDIDRNFVDPSISSIELRRLSGSALDDTVDGDDDDYHEYADVTNQTSTSLTLKCSSVNSLSYCFKKAHEVQPGAKELSLNGVSFSQPFPVPVETKNETLEILKIRAERGNVHHVLHAVAQNCQALNKLDLAFDVQDYPIEVAHKRSICHSLRVLELTLGQFTLKDLISVMDVISALYPNIQHLTINVKDQYNSDEESLIGSVSLQLHHLEDLKFSSTGMDPKAEKDLKMTMHVFCPELAPATSHDGIYFFRRIYGVSDYLDHLGGELSIPAHNVKLSIPPGALEDSEKISIEVFTNLPDGINLQDNEIAASFGIRCFPSGSSFKKPLTLSMPHCAVIDDTDVVGMVLHFGSDDEGEIRRIPLESNSYVIHADRIELQLYHFSWGILTMIYNWLYPGGNSESQATKRMLCTPFIPKTLLENQDLPIMHVRFYNKLPGLREEILAEEESIEYKKIFPDQQLIVKEHSMDMSISCQSEELPITHTKVMTKDLMQHCNITECMKLLQQRSSVTLILTQERKITMEFWTDIKGFSSLEKSPHGLGIMMVDKDDLFDELSKKFPPGKYATFCNKIGFGYNEAMKMLIKKGQDHEAALRDFLSQWDLKMEGVTRKQLEDALDGAEVRGLCSIVKKHYKKEGLDV